MLIAYVQVKVLHHSLVKINLLYKNVEEPMGSTQELIKGRAIGPPPKSRDFNEVTNFLIDIILEKNYFFISIMFFPI